MPIIVTRAETGIYRGGWQGSITTPEVFASIDELSAIATREGDDHLICIVDLTNCTKIPFDLHNLKNIANREARMSGFVVVKAFQLAKVMGQMLDRVSTKRFKFTDTLDEAIAMGREIREVQDTA